MRHRANLDAVTTEWGDGAFWHFRTNARGFRGRDWPAVPPPDTTRVLVMGDSMTFGDGVDEGGAYPDIADRLLRAAKQDGRRWEVLNLGVSAWGPQNALGYLESEGADIRAACLVYGFFLDNDVMDNVTYDLYRLHDGKLERTAAAEKPRRMRDRLRDIVHALQSTPVYDFLIEHSELFNIARNLALNLALRSGDPRAAHDAAARVYDQALVLNDATLTRMAVLARARFGAFGLVLIPPRDELVPDAAASADLAERARVSVLHWAAQHQVPVLDLVALLPHDRAVAVALYFKRDFHASAAGHRRIGALLAQNLPRLCAPATAQR